MEQLKIWDHFQNKEEMGDAFINALPRYEFLAKDIKPGVTALNIGVGRGGLESILTRNKVVVHCLDPSEETIDRLRKQYDLGARAQMGYSQNMPFQDGEFDVVIMSEVLEHLTDEILYATLVEVRRVLKSDGYFIGTVPANERLADSEVACPHCGKSFHRWGHVQSFDASTLKEVIQREFETVELHRKYFVYWRLLNFKGKIAAFGKRILLALGVHGSGETLVFVAKRRA